MKIAINTCFGGFSVSKAVYDYLGLEYDGYGYRWSDDRTNPKLIEAIEAVGIPKANGSCASIRIVEIPDNIDWHISEYDGVETIHENHRSWG